MGEEVLGISIDDPGGHGVADLGGIGAGFDDNVGNAAATEVGATED